MARPKKNAAEKRTEQTKERWTLAELEFVNQQAKLAGCTRAEFIRRRSLGRSISPARSSSADPALVTELNSIGVNVNQLAAASHQGRDFVRYWQEIGVELRSILTKVVANGS